MIITLVFRITLNLFCNFLSQISRLYIAHGKWYQVHNFQWILDLSIDSANWDQYPTLLENVLNSYNCFCSFLSQISRLYIAHVKWSQVHNYQQILDFSIDSVNWDQCPTFLEKVLNSYICFCSWKKVLKIAENCRKLSWTNSLQ